MAIDITLASGETFTLDETSDLQNGADGTPSGSARPDSDIALALPTAFSDYLYGSGAGQLDLDSIDASYLSYPTSIGVASSSTTFVHITSGSPLSTLGLTTSTGGSFDGTQTSGIFTTSGYEIFLVSALDNQVVLGMYDSDDDDVLDAYAFAVYMKTDGTLGSDEYVQLWTITFTALDHPISGATGTTGDDAVDLLQNVYIHATGALDINFDSMPSSANLFNDAAQSPSGGGIIVFGENVVCDPVTGKYTNASDTIHTSQGGDGATIGVDNQMFDPGDGAYFTFVRDIEDTYLSGIKPGGLSSTEADYQQNMQYDSLIESTGASIHISQTQGNNSAGMTIEAFELSSAYQGSDLITNAGENHVDILTVYVWDSTHTNVLESYTTAGPDDDGISGVIDISISGGIATVTGLDDGAIIEWTTDGDHNQVLIHDIEGAWDLGGFGITEGAEDTASLAGTAFVEDSGPTISPDITDGYVQFVASDSDTHSLNGTTGTDTPGVYTIESFESSFTYLGITVIGTINTDQTEVHYFRDVGGTVGEYDAGTDIDYFTMSLTPAGSYTFTVNNAPAPPPLVLDFDNLPSGSNLFGSVADDPDGVGIFVFGAATDLNGATSKYTNASDTIKTSQGGDGATIGVDNQMFDPGDGAFFTFVDDIEDNYLSGVAGGLTATEADYGNNLQYDGLHETNSAFIGISQIQAGSQASMAITAFLIDPLTAPQGVNLIDASGQSGDAVDIFSVFVYQGSVDPANLLESYSNGAEADMTDDITITIDTDGVAHVSGLDPGMVVQWSVDDPSTGAVEEHNQVLVEAEGGKFDVGFFGFSEAQEVPDQFLDFTVRLTDGDGDYVEDTFQVHVDATPYVV